MPKQLAAAAAAMLREAGVPRAAAQARTYFKEHETVHVYGVGAHRARQIESELFSRVKGAWSVAEAVDFCGILVRTRYH